MDYDAGYKSNFHHSYVIILLPNLCEKYDEADDVHDVSQKGDFAPVARVTTTTTTTPSLVVLFL